MLETMPMHPTASREEWLERRLDLLKSEKALTRQSDELALQRQALPWVKVDKDYRFNTARGDASLADLFEGRSQLIVYHFMFGPDYVAGCPSCSAIADGFNGIATHLANHGVMMWAVSRAPLAKLDAYKERMGWTFRWASSAGSEFNFDFGVGFTPDQQNAGVVYNFQEKPPLPSSLPATPTSHAGMCGVDGRTYQQELPGMSSFVLDNDAVYHSYSTYARGLDALWGMYPWLDRAPLGRNESGAWWKRHDEYAD